MAAIFDRVKVATATAGAGTIALGAAVGNGHRTFIGAGVPNGTVVPMLIEDLGNGAVEVSTGTYDSAANTVTRVLDHSSTGALLVLSGNATVTIIARRKDITPLLPIGTITANNTSQFIEFINLGLLSHFEVSYLNLQGASATFTNVQLSADNGATWSPAINIGYTNGAAVFHSGKFIFSNVRGDLHTPEGYANGSATAMADNTAVTLGPANFQFGTIHRSGGFNGFRIGNPGAVNWASGVVKAVGREA